nr:transposase, MuDR, MULE transposase domain protein [Tanacetum cinerariifolium]
HAAIALVVKGKFPLAYHAICCRHLMMNLSLKKDKTKALFWRICKAYTTKEFSRSMSHLQDIQTDAYDKLCQVGPQRWSRPHCPLVRYNYLTSNSVESFNACTIVYRKLPVLKLEETYRARVLSGIPCGHVIAVTRMDNPQPGRPKNTNRIRSQGEEPRGLVPLADALQDRNMLLIEEFCLVTGLKFGVEYSADYDDEDKPISFRRRVFPSFLDGKHITGKNVEDLIKSKSFKKLDNDAVSLCCIDILQLVLLVAWTSNKKFYRHMLRDFLHGRVPVVRLITDEVEAGSALDEEDILAEQILTLMHRFAGRFMDRMVEINNLMVLHDHPLIDYGKMDNENKRYETCEEEEGYSEEDGFSSSEEYDLEDDLLEQHGDGEENNHHDGKETYLDNSDVDSLDEEIIEDGTVELRRTLVRFPRDYIFKKNTRYRVRVKCIDEHSEWMVYAANEIAEQYEAMIYAHPERDVLNEYKKLSDYAKALVDTNPGTSIDIKIEHIGTGIQPYFKRMYVCLAAVREGFLDGCRKYLGLDGCFLKGVVKGMLLTVVGKNANNQIFPLAWAIVETESQSSWTWFLEHLKVDIRTKDGGEWAFMSDKQKASSLFSTLSCKWKIKWNGADEFQVYYGRTQHCVHIGDKTCSCGAWQLSGIPCCHATAAIMSRSKNLFDYLDQCYSKEKFIAVYNHPIKVVGSEEFWSNSDRGELS